MLSCVQRRSRRKLPNAAEENLRMGTGGRRRCVWDRFSFEGQREGKEKNLNDLSPAECWNEGVQKEMLELGERMDYWRDTGVVNRHGVSCILLWVAVKSPAQTSEDQMSFGNEAADRCVKCAEHTSAKMMVALNFSESQVAHFKKLCLSLHSMIFFKTETSIYTCFIRFLLVFFTCGSLLAAK